MFKAKLKEMLLEALFFCIAYFTDFLFPKIKETFFQYKDQFLESLWDKIKEDVQSQIKEAVKHVEEYFQSADYEVREKAAIDFIFQKVQLPLLLRPAKPLLKKMLKDKLRKVIAENLKKLDQKI